MLLVVDLEFKRNPDAKWKLRPGLLITFVVQSEVLESYSKIVKPGGKLVYATVLYYHLKIKNK
jgi:16S rRNA C967 or C1407 C5-methylase (RsmB/RsmF family)